MNMWTGRKTLAWHRWIHYSKSGHVRPLPREFWNFQLFHLGCSTLAAKQLASGDLQHSIYGNIGDCLLSSYLRFDLALFWGRANPWWHVLWWRGSHFSCMGRQDPSQIHWACSMTCLRVVDCSHTTFEPKGSVHGELWRSPGETHVWYV